MNIKSLATAVREASEGNADQLRDLPLAGADFNVMTVVSCTGNMADEIACLKRQITQLNSALIDRRAESDYWRGQANEAVENLAAYRRQVGNVATTMQALRDIIDQQSLLVNEVSNYV